MTHGPCGRGSNRPCSVTGKCRWGFPKPYAPVTIIKQNTYPVYKRPIDGRSHEKNGYTYTNRDVATYNPVLLRLMEAHVNVEAVTWISLVKYLFSYISKVSLRENKSGFFVFFIEKKFLLQGPDAAIVAPYNALTGPGADPVVTIRKPVNDVKVLSYSLCCGRPIWRGDTSVRRKPSTVSSP